jgi:hypothetical protein
VYTNIAVIGSAQPLYECATEQVRWVVGACGVGRWAQRGCVVWLRGQPSGYTASCAHLELPLSYDGSVEGNITYFVKRVRGPGAPAKPSSQLWLRTWQQQQQRRCLPACHRQSCAGPVVFAALD